MWIYVQIFYKLRCFFRDHLCVFLYAWNMRMFIYTGVRIHFYLSILQFCISSTLWIDIINLADKFLMTSRAFCTGFGGGFTTQTMLFAMLPQTMSNFIWNTEGPISCASSSLIVTYVQRIVNMEGYLLTCGNKAFLSLSLSINTIYRC